ncbi:MAG: hypothetical protein WA751_11315, partial [Candidatus Dormiibacterota bacterium]
VYVTRSRRRRRAEGPAHVDWIAQMPKQWRDRLQELLAEAAAEQPLPLDRGRSGKPHHRSLAASLAVRAARMAAPVAIAAAAERIGRRPAGAGSPGRVEG